jgi:hypothetical protein
MFRLNKDQATAARRLLVNPDFKTLCGLFEHLKDEQDTNCRNADGVELFRSQGRAQFLHDFLALEDAAAAALTPPPAPARAAPLPDTSFGQRDNPHFVQR